MKRFNGQKYSHARTKKPVPTCPICGSGITRFQGRLTCTELRRDRSGNSRRLPKHGSLFNILKNRA